ncbi:MAG: T9SS type A sorting domain-containing protein, partial [Bacteroidota bacterium]|nr:T9SS type A sorting domain-containing protein [Bacteroidota bacterium]
KNILLILVLCMFITVAVAQENSSARAFTTSPVEHTIGLTQYDLQSNTLLSNRIYRYADGSIGAVWTRGMEATSFPDRGTGYNYYDGTEWGPMPTERIESLRTGWPGYGPLGADGEIVVSHDYATNELYYMTRTNKGSGAWTETKYTYGNGPITLSWPRMITSGADNMSIHLLANSVNAYEGQSQACLYSRSLDGGATWDIENMILDEMGEDYYTEISADCYVWAEPRNGVIAFLSGWAWSDLFMMKSEDDGDTWEKTVIWKHPYPLFDFNVTLTDTFFAVDNSASIALGPDGKAHVVFGINRVLHEAVGGGYTFWPFTDGIGYWNEDMNRFSNDLDALAPPQEGYVNSEMVEDMNYIGWMQDVDGDGEVHLNGWPNYTFDNIQAYRELGASTMPSITVDDNGDVFVLFSSTTETYEIGLVNYKHVWARANIDGEWRDFYDLNEDVAHIFDECIYPQLAGTSDDFIYYFYNTDVTPGLALDEDHGYQDNNIVFASLPKSYLYPPWMIEERENNFGTVSQNQPNPFSGTSVIHVNLVETAHLILEVHNVFGQVVIQSDLGKLSPGTHAFTIDASTLKAGAYFYTIKSGKHSMSKRMIVN